MKYTIAYCLFFCYLLAICKPVLPLASDAISHFFWKAKHLATVHQQLGNHHSDEALQKAMEDEESKSGTTGANSSETISIHIFVQPLLYIPSIRFAKQLFKYNHFPVRFPQPNPPFTPPKVC